MHIRQVVLAVVFLQGCGADPADTAPVDTDPTTTPPAACTADVWVTHAEGGCFGTDDAWEFKADLAGCAETSALNLWRTDGEPWDEQHPMVLSSEGPDRIWQAWNGGPLAHATSSWVAGESSALDCQADTGKVTFAVRMFDTDGTLLSCAVWGHDPDLVVSGAASAVNGDPGASFADCEIKAF